MPPITVVCPECHKNTELTDAMRVDGFDVVMNFYSCGHTSTEKLTITTAPDGTITESSLDQDPMYLKGFPFQREGVKFIEASNYNCLVADEMGLGKTIQALLAVRRSWKQALETNSQSPLDRVLVVCPASLTFNWAKEYLQWIVNDLFPHTTNSANLSYLPIVKLDGATPMFPGFHFYIVSQDVLRKKKIQDSIREINFNLVIIDEVHKFKNTESARGEAILDLVEDIPHRIALSGTPIMNRLTEYYTALHIVAPEDWPNIKSLLRFAEQGPQGKILGLKSWMVDRFFNITKPYIIRRRRADVMKDLPPIVRDFKTITVNTNRALVGKYNEILDAIDLELASKNRSRSMFILALLQQLRHVTGLMKIAAATDFLEEFTLSRDPGEKLAIGIHHKDVGQYFCKITKEIYNIDAVTMSGADDATAKMEKERLFKLKENRFLVANIIACGEGRNLQFCPNALIVEREWNPAIEVQFELRFSRPLKHFDCPMQPGALYDKINDGKYKCQACDHEHLQDSVTITYLIAKDTIDEFFQDLLEMKRNIMGQILDPQWSLENDPDMIYKLAEMATAKRMKFVG